MADFFRYSMKSLNTDVDLQEEIELVDNYVSIMNVRFSGDIHYEKSIDCDITGVRVPCMIIQPAVENAISYGIRNISREGKIRLEVHREGSEILIHVRITVSASPANACRISAVERLHTLPQTRIPMVSVLEMCKNV